MMKSSCTARPLPRLDLNLNAADFCDEPVLWREGARNKPPRSQATAHCDDMKTAAKLRRLSEIVSGAGQLARRLARCSPDAPCGSGACQKENEALRRKIVLQAQSLPRAVRDGACSVTVTPADVMIVPGQLAHSPAVVAFHSRLIAALKRGGAKLAVGAIDFTLNKHAGGSLPDYWHPHAHMLVVSNDQRALARELRATFKGGLLTRMPVVVGSFDGDLRWLAYALDYPKGRRITQVKIVTPCGTTKAQHPVYRKLSSAEKTELDLALNELGLLERLVLVGITTKRTPH